MTDFLIILLSAVATLLRKLWQRLTGRVPVPIRVRRYAFPGADLPSRHSPFFPVEIIRHSAPDRFGRTQG